MIPVAALLIGFVVATGVLGYERGRVVDQRTADLVTAAMVPFPDTDPHEVRPNVWRMPDGTTMYSFYRPNCDDWVNAVRMGSVR